MKSRRSWQLALVAAVGALLAACSSSGSDGAAGTPATPSTPSTPGNSTASAGPTGSGAPAGPVSRPVATRYATRVLKDRPQALFPLAGGSPAAQESAALDAQVSGTAPVSTTGPRLLGVRTAAAAFSGQGRLITPVHLGGGAAAAWTVEFWLRDTQCANSFELIAGNASVGPSGRRGIYIFSYPKSANSPCRVGAELWRDGHFVGGCAGRTRQVYGTWHHYAVTRTATRTSCWVDGAMVNSRLGPAADVDPAVTWGIGGSGATPVEGQLSADLYGVAFYRRALPAAVVRGHAQASSQH